MDEVHFDVEIAIKVLRQAGYHSHALYLAEKHAHHEWYLKIQLEDIKVSDRFMPDYILCLHDEIAMPRYDSHWLPISSPWLQEGLIFT